MNKQLSKNAKQLTGRDDKTTAPRSFRRLFCPLCTASSPPQIFGFTGRTVDASFLSCATPCAKRSRQQNNAQRSQQQKKKREDLPPLCLRIGSPVSGGVAVRNSSLKNGRDGAAVAAGGKSQERPSLYGKRGALTPAYTVPRIVDTGTVLPRKSAPQLCRDLSSSTDAAKPSYFLKNQPRFS